MVRVAVGARGGSDGWLDLQHDRLNLDRRRASWWSGCDWKKVYWRRIMNTPRGRLTRDKKLGIFEIHGVLRGWRKGQRLFGRLLRLDMVEDLKILLLLLLLLRPLRVAGLSRGRTS